jgi:hypothetical protein
MNTQNMIATAIELMDATDTAGIPIDQVWQAIIAAAAITQAEAMQRQAEALEKIVGLLDFVIDDDSRTLSVRIPHAVSVGSMHP